MVGEAIYAHFIILFGAFVVMVIGVIDRLIGSVFGRFELRVIREFQSQITPVKKLNIQDQAVISF